MAHAGAKLERFQPAAKHRELVDGLRTLIALAGDARGEPIVGPRLRMRAKPNVLGPNRDLDRFAALYVGRHHRRESMATGLDDAELAVALEDAARDQARRTGEIRHEQVGGTIIDLVRSRQLQKLAVAHDTNAVAEHHRLGLIVGDVDRGDPGLLDDAPQVVTQPQPQLRVEITQWLVEKKELGLIDQTARQGYTLHLPAGERHHRAICELR